MTDVLFGRQRTAPTATDLADLAEQLGRVPRGVRAVAYRCAHRVPAVVETDPRLPDGTPFPTLYYLTCAVLTAAVSRMESDGVMADMTTRLSTDPDLAAQYQAAHRAYLAERNAIEDLRTGVSAGGMPDRVKCLHVLVAHALAAGPGTNRLGDEAITALSGYTKSEPPCVPVPETTS